MFVSHRINDGHDSLLMGGPTDPYLAPIRRILPEVTLNEAGFGKWALNFGIPQVREYTLALITEGDRQLRSRWLRYRFLPQPAAVQRRRSSSERSFDHRNGPKGEERLG